MQILKIYTPFDFDVIGDSGEKYLVNIEKESCTCMDWVMQTARMLPSDIETKVNPSYCCKHVKFVQSHFSKNQ